MRSARFAEWALAAVMAVTSAQGMEQQDEGPILRPKKMPAKPVRATLLVMCDLACNWKLDGKARGRIAAGDSVRHGPSPSLTGGVSPPLSVPATTIARCVCGVLENDVGALVLSAGFSFVLIG